MNAIDVPCTHKKCGARPSEPCMAVRQGRRQSVPMHEVRERLAACAKLDHAAKHDREEYERLIRDEKFRRLVFPIKVKGPVTSPTKHT
jgi:hypothetical protein